MSESVNAAANAANAATATPWGKIALGVIIVVCIMCCCSMFMSGSPPPPPTVTVTCPEPVRTQTADSQVPPKAAVPQSKTGATIETKPK